MGCIQSKPGPHPRAGASKTTTAKNRERPPQSSQKESHGRVKAHSPQSSPRHLERELQRASSGAAEHRSNRQGKQALPNEQGGKRARRSRRGGVRNTRRRENRERREREEAQNVIPRRSSSLPGNRGSQAARERTVPEMHKSNSQSSYMLNGQSPEAGKGRLDGFRSSRFDRPGGAGREPKCIIDVSDPRKTVQRKPIAGKATAFDFEKPIPKGSRLDRTIQTPDKPQQPARLEQGKKTETAPNGTMVPFVGSGVRCFPDPAGDAAAGTDIAEISDQNPSVEAVQLPDYHWGQDDWPVNEPDEENEHDEVMNGPLEDEAPLFTEHALTTKVRSCEETPSKSSALVLRRSVQRAKPDTMDTPEVNLEAKVKITEKVQGYDSPTCKRRDSRYRHERGWETWDWGDKGHTEHTKGEAFASDDQLVKEIE